MKFLRPEQAIDQINAGHAIEQWLGHHDAPKYRSIRWLRIERQKDGTINLARFEVFDQGNPEMRDIYSFDPVDPDQPNGAIAEFRTPEAAIAAARNLGANLDEYVGGGAIQDIYGAFLAEPGPIP